MKAIIRSEQAVREVGLLSEEYDDAVRECTEMYEDGTLLPDEEVILIIE